MSGYFQGVGLSYADAVPDFIFRFGRDCVFGGSGFQDSTSARRQARAVSKGFQEINVFKLSIAEAK